MDFTPINGQQFCRYSSERLGWFRLKSNGCAVLAIYNALGLLQIPTTIADLLQHFHAWYRPHFFGIMPWQIRSYLKKQQVPCQAADIETAEKRLQQGDVAIATYWNRCFFKKIPNPFSGAHTVCIHFGSEYTVYNLFSNRTQPYCFDSLSPLLYGRRLIKLYLLQNKEELL